MITTWDARDRFLDLSPADFAFLERVRPFTLTSPERILALRQSIHYLNRAAIPGDLVECGVWKGGSAMAALLAQREVAGPPRTLWLYDTFAGMSAPSRADIDYAGTPASLDLSRGHTYACSLATVRANLATVSDDPVTYVEGLVEQTLPATAPAQIALLRLDTDWYASTKHELQHLYPRLTVGGILIIDDYGHWQGARKAVDEFWAATAPRMHLVRIDYTGRLGVRLG